MKTPPPSAGRDSGDDDVVQWQVLLRRALAVLWLIIVVVIGWRELNGFAWSSLRDDIRALPLPTLLGLLLFGAAGLFAMSAYDALLARWNAIAIPRSRLLRYSWIANSFNNFVGFSGLAGSGIRYLLLGREGVKARNALAYSATIMLTIPVGLGVLAWPVLIAASGTHAPLGGARWLSYPALMAFALYVPLYWRLARSARLRRWLRIEEVHLTPRQCITLIVVSTLDWALAALVAWTAILAADVPVSLLPFVAAFVIASVLGVFSLLPGGIGVFDAILYYLLTAQGAPAPAVLAGILLFRAVYYLVPWLIGVYLAADLLAMDDSALLARLSRLWNQSGVAALIRVPLGFIATLGVRMAAWLTLLAGALLLISAASPVVSERLAVLKHLLPLSAVEGSHFLSAVSGVLLIGIARGIAARVRTAYRLAMVLLLGGALFSLLKGIDYEETLFLLMVAGLLRLRRRDFYRQSFPLLSLRNLGWLTLVVAAIASFVLLGSLIYGSFDPTNWLHFAYHLDESRFLRAVLGALVALLALLGWTLFLLPRPAFTLPDDADLAKARRFLETHGGSTHAHLLFLGDKSLFYSADSRALIQYGHIGNRLVALGDPSGDAASFAAVIAEFRSFADRHNLTPLFYQVSERHLGLYHELGFSLFKLGETALVPVASFTLAGKRNESLRHSVNKAKKAGATLEVLQPPLDDETWRALESISNAWLAEKSVAEKSFSLGRFDRRYLAAAPVAVVRRDQRIIAFASLMPQYGGTVSIGIDLMRHVPGAPTGVMDLLFSELIEYARAQDYQYLDLGMAPLAGVGESRYSKSQERLARLAYEYGNRLYNYKGLRSFKDKYHPEWRSSYLAYPAGVPASRVLADIAALIAGGYLRIFFKRRGHGGDD